MIDEGNSAPAFSLAGTDGAVRSLAMYQGHSSWCFFATSADFLALSMRRSCGARGSSSKPRAPRCFSSHLRRFLASLRTWVKHCSAGPSFSDPSREAYRTHGLGSASFARTWLSPRTVPLYARALPRGQRIRPPRADPAQLGGDFVLDHSGRVRLITRSSEPTDRPSVEKLLATIRARVSTCSGGSPGRSS